MLPLASVALVMAVGVSEDTVLGRIPAGYELVPGTVRAARDGSRAVCVVRKGEKEFPLDGDDLGAG